MSDFLFAKDYVMPVPSPCVGMCGIEASNGFCRGCWRTIDEITSWKNASHQSKRSTWQAIALRKQAAKV